MKKKYFIILGLCFSFGSLLASETYYLNLKNNTDKTLRYNIDGLYCTKSTEDENGKSDGEILPGSNELIKTVDNNNWFSGCTDEAKGFHIVFRSNNVKIAKLDYKHDHISDDRWKRWRTKISGENVVENTFGTTNVKTIDIMIKEPNSNIEITSKPKKDR